MIKRKRSINIATLPEIAQQELLMFYDFLIFKYEKQNTLVRNEKQRILSAIFQEANGKLPINYRFNREELYER